MRIILSTLLLVACAHAPKIQKEDPLSLINCRKENSCEKSDAVTWEKQEELIDQYCSTTHVLEREFCEQRHLTTELKKIDSTVSDFTYEIHKPLYGTSEI